MENSLLESFYNSVKLGEQAAWHQGWYALEFIQAEKAMGEFEEEDAITFLASEVKNLMQRKTIVDRMRVAKYFSRERYMTLGQPTFHQARAALVSRSRGIIDEDETNRVLQWCVDNNWPTVEEIFSYKGGGKDEPDYVELARKACSRVIEKNAGSEDFQRICKLVSNYRAGSTWDVDTFQIGAYTSCVNILSVPQ